MLDRDEAIDRIIRTRRAIRRRMAQQSHPLLDMDLTMPQLKVMILLSELGATSGSQLADRTGTGLATLTGIVDRLVARGLVTRAEDPRDRRVRRLELTTAGAELVDGMIAAGEDHQQHLYQRLDDVALNTVADAFDLILGAIGSEPDEQ